MRHSFAVRVGPAGFRIGSPWRGAIAGMRELYRGYPTPHDGIPDFGVRLEPDRPWRRWLRPSLAIRGDYMLPDALPLPLHLGLLAGEMGMNLQMALGHRRQLLLHASAVERDGRALLMTGASGSGKSTLSALLGQRGWRFLGDEFALVDLRNGALRPFPRPISLKNESIGLFPAGEIVAVLEGTPKGRLGYLRAPADAVARMDDTAQPALILFPRFGHAKAVRPIARSEVFVRLTQASTNYVALGEPGFDALTRLVREVPARAIDYPDTSAAIDLVESLWAELAQ